ncbi:leucine-rich repeat protein, putative [Bodo saltans]|uniref:Leucine-rich repeat protein, putative n=1 Tax=Bodo saltans TaxID=75058 RepID=A0A0S4J1S9_BODSA|nr:leucine-rich repeat protein, putative [Bodo saltans]|eukprot:CUG11258.1 leucine-rich repeat protein, putative [Bodo saltans]
MKRYFLEELTLNQQLFIKHILPRVRANDETLEVISRPPRAHNKRLSSVELPGSLVPSLMRMTSPSDGGPLQQQQPSFIGLHNDIGCEHIAEALLYNTHITELDLSAGLVTDRGCIAIARSLMVNRSLTSLTLSHNSIGDEGVLMLASVLQVNPILRSVDVSSSRMIISPIALDRLRIVLTQNDTVRNISLAPQPKPTSAGSNNTGRSSVVSRTTSAVSSQSRAQAQKDMLLSQSRLALVSALNSIHLGLKEFLRHDSDGHISREIDCSKASQQDGRKFDREACRILCSALAQDQYITQLNLSDNNLDNECAQMIATLLETNVAITSIDLSGNSRISDGANILHDALIKNHSVVSLKLVRCNCASLILEKVQMLLNLNREHIAMKYEVLELLKRKEAHTLCRVNVAEVFPVDVLGYPGIANRKQQLDDESMDIFSQVLRADVIVTGLDFAWNVIGDSGFHTLLLLLKRNKGLTSVHLNHNVITDESIKQLSFVISQIPCLSFLDLAFNQLTAEIVPLLVQILRKAPALHKILLEGNRIGPRDRDTVSFFGLLNEKCSLELRTMLTTAFDNLSSMSVMDMNSFYSCGNWLPDGTTMQLLCFSLLSNTNVTSLELEFNDIDNKQFHALCHLLQTNRSIKRLNLANNLIEDVEYFVERDGFQLTHLSLRKNRLGKQAAMSFARFLRKNKTLVSLDISQNMWGRAGVSMINEALPMNTCLRELEISGEGIPAELEERAQYSLTLNYNTVVLPPN